MSDSPELPAGVHVRRLAVHSDERGSLAELYRRSWEPSVEPVQWNVVRSHAGVLRGVHAHVRHDDYLVIQAGHASVGLQDLRRRSPTFELGSVVELRGDELSSIVIPRGVAHAFFFREESVHIYAMTRPWDPTDELGCHWQDPELTIPWRIDSCVVSPRDGAASSLRAMQASIDAALTG